MSCSYPTLQVLREMQNLTPQQLLVKSIHLEDNIKTMLMELVKVYYKYVCNEDGSLKRVYKDGNEYRFTSINSWQELLENEIHRFEIVTQDLQHNDSPYEIMLTEFNSFYTNDKTNTLTVISRTKPSWIVIPNRYLGYKVEYDFERPSQLKMIQYIDTEEDIYNALVDYIVEEECRGSTKPFNLYTQIQLYKGLSLKTIAMKKDLLKQIDDLQIDDNLYNKIKCDYQCLEAFKNQNIDTIQKYYGQEFIDKYLKVQ